MKRTNSVNETLRVLKKVIFDIQQSGECSEAIQSIAKNRQDIIKGVNEDDGSAVVDSLERHLEKFFKLACAKEVFSGALETLSVCRTSPETLPSVTALCTCLEVLVLVADEKDALDRVINTDYGSVVNDYLQGHPLTMIENVTNACAEFQVICDHVDEMVMLNE